MEEERTTWSRDQGPRQEEFRRGGANDLSSDPAAGLRGRGRYGGQRKSWQGRDVAGKGLFQPARPKGNQPTSSIDSATFGCSFYRRIPYERTG